jgi:uncharacterized protein YkwD
VTPLAALNAHRARAGLAALVEDAALVQMAETRAGQIAHHYAHADDLPASEVLTVGRFDAASLIWEWLSWPQHRRIILDPRARRAGFGRFTKEGQTYWVGLIGG